MSRPSSPARPSRLNTGFPMKQTVLLIAPSLGFESIFPLGLSTIASALMADGKVCIGLDERARPGCLETALAGVDPDSRPMAAVIEASPRNVNQALDAAARCAAADIPAIFVGPAAATDARAMMDSSCAFASVTGDPETVLLRLLDELANPVGAEIPGARFRIAGGVLTDSPPVFDMDPAGLVYDRTVFPVSDYCDHPRHPEFRQAAIETSRGCTLDCTFCPVPCRYERKWRGRPIAAIVQEMSGLHRDYGITDFVIEDDQPLADIERFQTLMKAIRTALPGISMAFSNGLRPELLNISTLQLMAAAGTRDISLGIESGSSKVRASLNRPISTDQVQGIITEAHRLKMVVTGYFMLGLPGETVPQMLETIMMANRFRFDYVHFMVYHPWHVTTGPASLAFNHVRTAAYLGSYCNPMRLAGLARSGHISPGRARADASRLIEWIMAGRTGGGTW